jgi:hypothetical protein
LEFCWILTYRKELELACGETNHPLSQPALSRCDTLDGAEANLAVDVLYETGVERALDDRLVSKDV